MQSEALLAQHNIKVTKARVLILKCLQDEVHFHSVADIARHLGLVNTKSIYNNIKVLAAAGLIDAYTFHGTAKYALSDDVRGHHNAAHLVNDNDLVSHLELPASVYAAIARAVKKTGRAAKAIKIFAEAD